MVIGVPSEVKPDEYRVGMRPVGAEVLVREGHTVLVQAGAGTGSGFTDEQYTAAGATIVKTAQEVWAKAEMIVKASPDWMDHVTQMVKTREKASLLKVQLEYIRMKFSEWQSFEATKRAEMKL